MLKFDEEKCADRASQQEQYITHSKMRIKKKYENKKYRLFLFAHNDTICYLITNFYVFFFILFDFLQFICCLCEKNKKKTLHLFNLA